MAELNELFFRLYEITFLVNREDPEVGEEKALELMAKYFETGLKRAYDDMGFRKGDAREFARIVGARDRSVGLDVRFPVVTKDKIVYQFHDDPFPGLKGEVEPEKLDATYMAFKVRYLLGDDWGYTTTKHIWKDGHTEHVIEKKA